MRYSATDSGRQMRYSLINIAVVLNKTFPVRSTAQPSTGSLRHASSGPTGTQLYEYSLFISSLIIINEIYIAQVRKSQRNCETVPQMRRISYAMSNR